MNFLLNSKIRISSDNVNRQRAERFSYHLLIGRKYSRIQSKDAVKISRRKIQFTIDIFSKFSNFIKKFPILSKFYQNCPNFSNISNFVKTVRIFPSFQIFRKFSSFLNCRYFLIFPTFCLLFLRVGNFVRNYFSNDELHIILKRRL